jgi:hypothetical protein
MLGRKFYDSTRKFGSEVFNGTQYHPVPPIEKDSYVIQKDMTRM